MTLWSGRFDTAPDPAAFDFGISFGFDRALFEDDVRGSLAWAEALGESGELSAEDTASITQGLTAILEDGCRDPAFVTGPDEVMAQQRLRDGRAARVAGADDQDPQGERWYRPRNRVRCTRNSARPSA